MSARAVAVLLWWLSCCASAVWRYYINGSDYSIFSTRSSIALEYEGTSFSSWEIPELCKVESSNSTRTKLHCDSAGVYNIKPNVKDKEEERFLSVDSSHICFMWYYRV
uniref:CATSPERE first N-terminal domain-containing protein n=1 Tax=Cricetulus griseus TaxID=10029 RepID=A0A8C2QPV9_CRIGR